MLEHGDRHRLTRDKRGRFWARQAGLRFCAGVVKQACSSEEQHQQRARTIEDAPVVLQVVVHCPLKTKWGSVRRGGVHLGGTVYAHPRGPRADGWGLWDHAVLQPCLEVIGGQNDGHARMDVGDGR